MNLRKIDTHCKRGQHVEQKPFILDKGKLVKEAKK